MRSFSLLALLFAFQIAACAETPEHKAWLQEMERRHTVVVETMSGTGGM